MTSTARCRLRTLRAVLVQITRRHNLFFIPYRPEKFLHAEASPKNLISDDHFDRSFSFMAMEGKPQKQKKTKDHNSTVNKSG